MKQPFSKKKYPSFSTEKIRFLNRYYNKLVGGILGNKEIGSDTFDAAITFSLNAWDILHPTDTRMLRNGELIERNPDRPSRMFVCCGKCGDEFDLPKTIPICDSCLKLLGRNEYTIEHIAQITLNSLYTTEIGENNG